MAQPFTIGGSKSEYVIIHHWQSSGKEDCLSEDSLRGVRSALLYVETIIAISSISLDSL